MWRYFVLGGGGRARRRWWLQQKNKEIRLKFHAEVPRRRSLLLHFALTLAVNGGGGGGEKFPLARRTAFFAFATGVHIRFLSSPPQNTRLLVKDRKAIEFGGGVWTSSPLFEARKTAWSSTGILSDRSGERPS
jgi:hypothetical protein